MTDILDVYINRKIYKSLANPAFFKRRVSQEKMMAFLDKVFSENSDFNKVIEKLETRLNKQGIDTFKARYRKYKSAHKRRSNSFTISLSTDIGYKLVAKKNELGFETYDELLDYILADNDHK